MTSPHLKLSDLFNRPFLHHASGSRARLSHPKYPDLAKVWRSGGPGRNSWSGDLGFLALHAQLDQAVATAQAKLSLSESYRFYRAVIDWATSLFAQVSPSPVPLSFATPPSAPASPSGPCRASISLFAVPVFSTPDHAQTLLGSSAFAASFRQAEVFDPTSSTAFLGLLPLAKVFSLTPQTLYEFMRILRPEMLNYWHSGQVALSPVARNALQTLLSPVPDPVSPPESSPFSSAPFLREHVLLGVRFALCRPDGYPHDLLSQRRSTIEDDNSLTAWQRSFALLPENIACPHHLQAADPCPFSDLPLNFLAFALENHLFHLAHHQFQSSLDLVEFIQSATPPSLPASSLLNVDEPPFSFALLPASSSSSSSLHSSGASLRSAVWVAPEFNLDYYLPRLQSRWPTVRFTVTRSP